MIELIGTREVAEILGMSRSTVNRRTGLGLIPHVEKLPGRLGNYLFNRHEIESLVKESTK